MKTLALALILVSSSTWAATAYFVSQRTETSVTGRMVTVCTYSYNGQYFDRVFPGFITCPMRVEVY